jgi:hypothetical protein
MGTRKPPHTTRICDEGLALDETTKTPNPTTATADFRAEDWAARRRVRTVVRELRRPNPNAASSPNRIAPDRLPLDPPQDLFAQIEHATSPDLAPITSPLRTGRDQSSRQHNARSEGSQLVAWLTVIIGMLALGSGLGLIAWSLSTGHMLYWNLATGLALGGQGTLILGLVLVISRLWRSSRYAATKL